MDYIREKFAVIEDNRHPGYVKHELEDILIIIMCGVMCGLDELTSIAAYAQSKADFLNKYFNITQIPSKSTLMKRLWHIYGKY